MSAAFGASLLVIVAVLGLGFYASTRKSEDGGTAAAEVSAAPEAVTPFDDLPPERPPERKPRPGSGPFEEAPDDLDRAPVWQTALLRAEESNEWLAKATAARDAGDHAEYQRCAKQAKRLLEEAFEATAAWEEGLVERYGERGRGMRAILRTRQDWTLKLVALRKTTSR